MSLAVVSRKHRRLWEASLGGYSHAVCQCVLEHGTTVLVHVFVQTLPAPETVVSEKEQPVQTLSLITSDMEILRNVL